MFLAPVFLWGLLGLSVPVFIHMLRSSRTNVIRFPSIRFLKECRQRAARRRRIKDLLLLLLRAALVALVAFGLAKPWKRQEGTEAVPDARVSLVIVLDNSYSMGYVERGTSRFERARQAAMDLVDALKPGDEAAVILFNEKAIPFVREFTTDLDAVKKALRQARISVLGTNIEEALHQAIRLNEPGATDEPGTPRRREIHVLTDMQASGWDSLRESGSFDGIETRAAIYVSSFARADSPNAFIESAEVTATGSKEYTVTARVRAVGAGMPGNIITLSVNGANVMQEAFTVRPGTPALVPLSARFPAGGTYLCTLALQDDALGIDDRFYFAVDIGERSSVLVVDGDPSPVAQFGETYYVRAALNLGDRESAAMDARIVSIDELPSEDLAGVGCLVLCNVARLDGTDLVRSERYLGDGGNVLVFLGGQVDASHCNTWSFLPISLTALVGDPSRDHTFRIGAVDATHPLFSDGIDLRSTRFFMCYGSDRATLKEGAAVIAEFSNNQPALVEGRFENGRVMVFTSTCDLDWSTFPLRRAFLPWLYRTLAYLQGQKAESAAFRLNDEVAFRAPAAHYRDTVTVTSPEGDTAVLRPEMRGEQVEAVYRRTAAPGMYRVDADPAFTPAGGFGVNPVIEESVLATASREEIAAALPEGLVTFLDVPGEQIAQQVKQARRGEEIWPLLFKLAVLIYLIESIAGNILARTRSEKDTSVRWFQVLRQRWQPGGSGVRS